MQADDFTWIKGRIDDLAKKWADDKKRDWDNLKITRDALQALLRVERDDKGNHYSVMRDIAMSALERIDC